MKKASKGMYEHGERDRERGEMGRGTGTAATSSQRMSIPSLCSVVTETSSGQAGSVPHAWL